MRKIKAFTLIELMIVMLISTIVFGIAFLALKTVTTFHLNQISNNAEISTCRTLNKILEDDFERSSGASLRNIETLSLAFPSGMVNYYIGQSFILRNLENGVVDSFKLISPLTPLATKYADNNGEMINEIELTILLHKDPLVLHYYKVYSPDISINKTIDSLYHELH